MEADDDALLGLLSLERISIGPFIGGGQHIDNQTKAGEGFLTAKWPWCPSF